MMGLARTGSYASNGSGDYVVAFSTHRVAAAAAGKRPTGVVRSARQRRDVSAVRGNRRGDRRGHLQRHFQSDDGRKQSRQARGHSDRRLGANTERLQRAGVGSLAAAALDFTTTTIRAQTQNTSGAFMIRNFLLSAVWRWPRREPRARRTRSSFGLGLTTTPACRRLKRFWVIRQEAESPGHTVCAATSMHSRKLHRSAS